MEKHNLPPFYIGQKVVALKNMRQGIKKGDVFPVKNIAKWPCNCTSWVIDIGYFDDCEKCCCDCRTSIVKPIPGALIISANNFAPLQQQKFPLMTFKQVVKKEKEHVLIDN